MEQNIKDLVIPKMIKCLKRYDSNACELVLNGIKKKFNLSKEDGDLCQKIAEKKWYIENHGLIEWNKHVAEIKKWCDKDIDVPLDEGFDFYTDYFINLDEGAKIEYLKYVNGHINNVKKGYRWMKKNLPELFLNQSKIKTSMTIAMHDLSKFRLNKEFKPYATNFKGTPEEKEANRPAFKQAWNHHQKVNKHHWQYWVLINGSGKMEVLDMPFENIVEMICDWWSFSWKDNDLEEIFNWYAENKNKMILSPKTRTTVEMILQKMKTKLEQMKKDKKLEESIHEFDNINYENTPFIYEEYELNEDITNTNNEFYSLTETVQTKINLQEIKNIAKLIKKETDIHEKEGPYGNQNCMLCTWAGEMQLRGDRKFLPRPVFFQDDPIFNLGGGYTIVKNPIKESIKDKNDVYRKVLSNKNSRYYCHINWKNSKSGHEFLLLNLDDNVYIFDAQDGNVINIKNDNYYFDDINYKNSFIVRLDDKEIDKNILRFNNKEYLKNNKLDESFLPNLSESSKEAIEKTKAFFRYLTKGAGTDSRPINLDKCDKYDLIVSMYDDKREINRLEKYLDKFPDFPKQNELRKDISNLKIIIYNTMKDDKSSEIFRKHVQELSRKTESLYNKIVKIGDSLNENIHIINLTESVYATKAQKQYSDYLITHVSNTKKGYFFIKENCPEMLAGADTRKIEDNIIIHDESKYSKEEYNAYSNFFYGERTDKVKADFKLAWQHHWTHNPHHPEYWHGSDMPLEYIIEMICDWWSFSWKDNDLSSIFEFWEKAKVDKHKKLSENTKNIVQQLLNILKDTLIRMDLI